MPDCTGKCVFVRWKVKPGKFTPPAFDELCGEPQWYTPQQIADDLKKIAENWADNNSKYQQLCNQAGCHCAKKLEDETPGLGDLVTEVSRTVAFGPWKESHKVGDPAQFISCTYKFELSVQLSKYRLQCKCVPDVADQPAPPPPYDRVHLTGKECLGQCVYRQWWYNDADVHVTFHHDSGCPAPTAAIKDEITKQLRAEANATIHKMSTYVSQCQGANCDCDKRLDIIGSPLASATPVQQQVITISTKGNPVVVKKSAPGTGAEKVDVTCHYWGTADVPFSAYMYYGECVPNSLQ
jgi:hypothetical protein